MRTLRGPGRPRGSRAWYAAAVAVLAGVTVGVVVVVLVGGSGGSDRPGTTSSAGGAPGVSDPVAVPAPSVLPAAGVPTASPPSTAGLTSALAKPLAAPVLGPRVGMVVVDPVSGSALYGSSATSSLAPASTAKLVTAASVLHLLGGDATIKTRTVAGATPADVVLVGGGDPTITRTGTRGYPRGASLDALAEQTASALPASSRGAVHLTLDDSLFTGPRTGPGWSPADVTNGLVARVSALSVDEDRVRAHELPRYPDPTAAAGRVFTAALRKYGVTVTTTSRGTAPAAAAQLGTVSSPPVSALVEQMLLTSDNDLAEALAHLSGVAAGTGGSFSGGAAASAQTLTWLGVDPAGVRLVDGSGISSQDRLTPTALADVLVAATRADHPELAPLLSGLPVAGVSGSLADRFDTAGTAPARGQVRAKTGTLTGVNGLAGTVLDSDGRTLVFVTLADRTSTDTLAARAALDRVAAVLETCGCR